MEEAERTVLFTNTYTTSEQTDKQMFSRIRRLPRLIVLLLSNGFLAYLIYWLIGWIRESSATGQPFFSNSSSWVFLLGIALYVLLLVREILAPGTLAKRQAQRLKESYGTTEITVDAEFSDDGIRFHNRMSNGELKLGYINLNLLTETKDLFLVRTSERQIIALSKTGFSGTDEKGFRTFMQTKCPQAKCTWKKGSKA